MSLVNLPDVLVRVQVVDQGAHSLGPDLLSPIPKNEHQSVDDVALAAAVGPDDGREDLVERSQNLKHKSHFQVI